MPEGSAEHHDRRERKRKILAERQLTIRSQRLSARSQAETSGSGNPLRAPLRAFTEKMEHCFFGPLFIHISHILIRSQNGFYMRAGRCCGGIVNARKQIIAFARQSGNVLFNLLIDQFRVRAGRCLNAIKSPSIQYHILSNDIPDFFWLHICGG